MSPSAATKFATKLARKKRKNPKVKVRQILNNPFVDAFINICIIWALFSEDVRALACLPMALPMAFRWPPYGLRMAPFHRPDAAPSARMFAQIRVLLWPKTMDYAVWWVHLFVMCVFLLELAARSYSQRGFFLSFYFSLDFLASTTMIMDWMPLMQARPSLSHPPSYLHLLLLSFMPPSPHPASCLPLLTLP